MVRKRLSLLICRTLEFAELYEISEGAEVFGGKLLGDEGEDVIDGGEPAVINVKRKLVLINS